MDVLAPTLNSMPVSLRWIERPSVFSSNSSPQTQHELRIQLVSVAESGKLGSGLAAGMQG